MAQEFIQFKSKVSGETAVQIIRRSFPCARIRGSDNNASFLLCLPALPRRTRMSFRYIIFGKIKIWQENTTISFSVYPDPLCMAVMICPLWFLAVSVVYSFQGYNNVVPIFCGVAACIVIYILVVWQWLICKRKFRSFFNKTGNGSGTRGRFAGQGDGSPVTSKDE